MAEVAVRADVPEHLRDRVDKMFRRDSRAAITLITVLWLTIFFVILSFWILRNTPLYPFVS